VDRALEEETSNGQKKWTIMSKAGGEGVSHRRGESCNVGEKIQDKVPGLRGAEGGGGVGELRRRSAGTSKEKIGKRKQDDPGGEKKPGKCRTDK